MIEFLTVVAIVAVLLALLLSAVQRTRESASRLQCQSHLMQLSLAVHSCNDSRGRLPPAGGMMSLSTQGGPPLTGSGQYFLLPYVEEHIREQRLADEAPIRLSCGCTQHAAVKFAKVVSSLNDCILHPEARTPRLLRCPSETKSTDGTLVAADGSILGTTPYVLNLQVFGNHQLNSSPASIERSMPDGTSNTAILAERSTACRGVQISWLADEPDPGSAVFGFDDPRTGRLWLQAPQIRPTLNECKPYSVQSQHAGGLIIGFGDGSVRVLRPSIEVDTWRRIILPADGEVLGD